MCFGNWGTWVVEGRTLAELLVAEAGSQQASSSLGGAGSRSPSSFLYVQMGLWELSLNIGKELGSDQKAEFMQPRIGARRSCEPVSRGCEE